jgi:hypothetical protein
MNYRSTLSPAVQRRLLTEETQIWMRKDLEAKAASTEALARSRELLRVPVYRSPMLSKDG